MLITTVCLFSICITLTLIFYHWHTLSLYSCSSYRYRFISYRLSGIIFYKSPLYRYFTTFLALLCSQTPYSRASRKGLPWNPVQKNWVLGLRYLVYTSLEVLGSSATSSCITELMLFFKAENLVPQVSLRLTLIIGTIFKI